MTFPPDAQREQHPPRVWPSLVVLFLGLALVEGIRAAVDHNVDLESAGALPFLAWNILPMQAGLLAVVVLVALASPTDALQRLGFVPPRTEFLTLLMLVPATFLPLGVGHILSLLLVAPEDEYLRVGERIDQLTGPGVFWVGLLLTIPPGLCEETFFRGFVQRRLSGRWPALLAIGLPALVFAWSHAGTYNAVAVLPVGLWFGYVTWTTRSVWPAIFCHAFNNAYVFAMKWLSEDEFIIGVGVGLTAVSITCFPAAVARLERRRQRSTRRP